MLERGCLMQEEVENRTVTLVINTTRLTARTLKTAILKVLAERKRRKALKASNANEQVIPHGKQSVRQLIGQNQGVSNIEVTNQNIKAFERVARKYGVDFAVKKDKSSKSIRYLVFFKARDADALTAAFKDFTAKKMKKSEHRQSVLKKLEHFKEVVKNTVRNRTRKKERER